MPRLMLTDEKWKEIQKILLQDRVYNKSTHRKTIEGILFRMRTGCPWRDLPEAFGKWNTVFRRFNLWSKKGILLRLFKEMSKDSDLERGFIDGSLVKAHQHSTGAAKTDSKEAIGKSVSGNSTKIHMAVDSYGLPIHFELTGGHVHDSKKAPEIIDALRDVHYIIADKGYDSELIREKIRGKKSIPVIPRRQNSLTGTTDMDWYLYQLRHLVENAFARLKHFRAIATRYDKLARNFASTLALACAVMWLSMSQIQRVGVS